MNEGRIATARIPERYPELTSKSRGVCLMQYHDTSYYQPPNVTLMNPKESCNWQLDPVQVSLYPEISERSSWRSNPTIYGMNHAANITS